ncbi:MAG: diadenylate cyclase CdaA [Bacteroidales bacterium]|nr:diadenylate cyclase CdaA [Bacteroidales bacterium]MDD3664291.1 diadenylate cyclase CdaA [Bacteroidales bacterium]
MFVLLSGFLEFRLIDAIDILLVAFLLYELFNLLKGTSAISIFFGIVAVIVLWKVVNVLEMALLSEILGAFISVGFIALIVVFQPEIRQFLLLLGNSSFINNQRRRFLFWKLKQTNERLDVDTIVQACQKMAHSKTGALIVIAKTNDLRQYADTGDEIDARLNEQLIENIFFKNSPLHDGAAIIRHNRIHAARCILPVSSNMKIDVALGLRHRAAVGITERTDAVSVIVSEETGEISYAKAGIIVAHVKPAQLKNFLDKEFNTD